MNHSPNTRHSFTFRLQEVLFKSAHHIISASVSNVNIVCYSKLPPHLSHIVIVTDISPQCLHSKSSMPVKEVVSILIKPVNISKNVGYFPIPFISLVIVLAILKFLHRWKEEWFIFHLILNSPRETFLFTM